MDAIVDYAMQEGRPSFATVFSFLKVYTNIFYFCTIRLRK